MSCGTLDTAGAHSISPTGLSPCIATLPNVFGYRKGLHFAVRTPGILLLPVWPLPRSLATTYGISVDFFSSPYLDVSVQAVPHAYLWIQHTLPEYCSGGFPHSEICGSVPICGSPQLIAACRVLHRLSVPRHSPCALYSLTSFVGGSRYAPLRWAPKGFALWTPTIFSRKNRLKASSSPAGGTKVFGIRKLSSTLHCCNYINKNLENLGLFFS